MTLMDLNSITFSCEQPRRGGSQWFWTSWDGRVYKEEAQTREVQRMKNIGFKKGSLPTVSLRTKMCETQTLEIAFFRELSCPSVAFESDVDQAGLEV